MRCVKIADLLGRVMRLGVMIVAASLLLVSIVRATEMKDLTEKLPRAYFGEFLWDGDKVVQNVVITFESVRALNDRNAEALGCGAYEVGRQVTKIKGSNVRQVVRPADRNSGTVA